MTELRHSTISFLSDDGHADDVAGVVRAEGCGP